MFVVFISVICLIISLFFVNVLYNIVNKFVYSVSHHVVSDFYSVQCIFVGVLLVVLCVLEVDLVLGVCGLLF